MKKIDNPDSPFKAGMYLLDSFTSGMYNDPLIVYREYIQNAVDSIDVAQGNGALPLEVRIQLDPATRSITICDNALGVSAAQAEEVLSAIGSSNKSESGLRGFRGIGRLGGIAFSDRAIFRTKAKGESVESIQEWDCRTLRKLLAEQKKESLTLEEVFWRVTSFRQEPSYKTQYSYFEVSLIGVSSFRNQLFDLERVRRYLRQVAPVPFSVEEFSYALEIDQYLSARITNYGRYDIFLNGEPIRKPYRDSVRITKGDADAVDGIEFFSIDRGKDRPLAYGWYGRRRELLGSIARGDDSSGVRVRVGNIQIGDAHLLDSCYREPRFNSYVTGEIHVTCPHLIPNSRRDDFVDNHEKGQFYTLIEKVIGLPISKEIRSRSRLASVQLAPKSAMQMPKPSATPMGAMDKNADDSPAAKCRNCTDQEVEGTGNDGKALSLQSASEQAESSLLGPSTLNDQTLRAVLTRLCHGCPKLAKLVALLQQKDATFGQLGTPPADAQ